MFTIGVKGGYEMGVRLVDNCQLFSHVANIGDTRSLIIHPASTTHRQLDEEQQVAAGAGPDVVRLSIGIETADGHHRRPGAGAEDGGVALLAVARRRQLSSPSPAVSGRGPGRARSRRTSRPRGGAEKASGGQQGRGLA